MGLPISNSINLSYPHFITDRSLRRSGHFNLKHKMIFLLLVNEPSIIQNDSAMISIRRPLGCFSNNDTYGSALPCLARFDSHVARLLFLPKAATIARYTCFRFCYFIGMSSHQRLILSLEMPPQRHHITRIISTTTRGIISSILTG